VILIARVVLGVVHLLPRVLHFRFSIQCSGTWRCPRRRDSPRDTQSTDGSRRTTSKAQGWFHHPSPRNLAQTGARSYARTARRAASSLLCSHPHLTASLLAATREKARHSVVGVGRGNKWLNRQASRPAVWIAKVAAWRGHHQPIAGLLRQPSDDCARQGQVLLGVHRAGIPAGIAMQRWKRWKRRQQ